MRIRVDDPALLSDLLEYLRARVDAVVTQVGDDEVEVSLLGSLSHEAMRMELYLRVRAWEAARRAGSVELID